MPVVGEEVAAAGAAPARMLYGNTMTEHLASHEFRTTPEAWLFDRQGNWIGLEHPAAP